MNDTLAIRLILMAAVLSMVVMAAGFAQKKFQEDVFSTSGGELKITMIGHGTLMFTYAGKVIHIDPVSMFADYATLPKADAILITHEHFDHLDAKAIKLIRKADTEVIISPSCAKSLPDAVVMKNGETRTVARIKVEAVPAYNPSEPFHPKGNGNGYIFNFGDKRVYVAGDTENVPEIKALKNIDVAFLPMNQPYTMTPEQVADVAKAMQPKVLYPYHYSETDPNKLVDLLKDEKGIEVRIRDLK